MRDLMGLPTFSGRTFTMPGGESGGNGLWTLPAATNLNDHIARGFAEVLGLEDCRIITSRRENVRATDYEVIFTFKGRTFTAVYSYYGYGGVRDLEMQIDGLRDAIKTVLVNNAEPQNFTGTTNITSFGTPAPVTTDGPRTADTPKPAAPTWPPRRELDL